MKIRRRKLDIIFSNLVREKYNYVCQYCGTDCRTTGLDCAHIMRRRHVATRWHPVNAIALCRKDHIFFGEHDFDWVDWCRERFGYDLIEELRRIANTTVNWTPAVREDIYQHYRHEWGLMEAQRNLGITKVLEFEAHEIMHSF